MKLNIKLIIMMVLTLILMFNCEVNAVNSMTLEKQINKNAPYNQVIIQYNSENFRKVIYSNELENGCKFSKSKAEDGYLFIFCDNEEICFNLLKANKVAINETELLVEYD